MAYGDELVRISRIANGYEIEMREPCDDPGETDSPQAPRMSVMPEYEWRTYAVRNFNEVIKFLQQNRATLGDTPTPAEEYQSSFKEAVSS